jgi:hypothetical protein
MIITVNQATLPLFFVHYCSTHLFKQPQPKCRAMDARDEDQPEQSK